MTTEDPDNERTNRIGTLAASGINRGSERLQLVADGGADPDPVEDAWVTTLTAAGVDATTAEELTTAVQTHHATVFGPAGDTAPQAVVEQQIKAIDLSEFDIDDPDAVKADLLEIAAEGFAGARPGPVSAATGAGPTEWAPTEAGAADSEAAETHDDAEADASADDVEVVDRLEEMIDTENDIQVDDIKSTAGGVIAGAAGMVDDNGLLDDDESTEALSANADDSTTADGDDSSAEPDAQPDDETESEAEQSAEGSGGSELDADKLLRMLAIHQFRTDQDDLARVMEVPPSSVQTPMIQYGEKVAQTYEHFIKSILFEGYSEAEKEILYNQLVKDKIVQYIKRQSDDSE